MYKLLITKKTSLSALRTRQPALVRIFMIQSKDLIWIFYKPSKGVEPIRWLEVNVIHLEDDFVIHCRSAKGFAMKVSYKPLHLAQLSKTARVMMSVSLENKIKSDSTTKLPNLPDIEQAAKSVLDSVIKSIEGVFGNDKNFGYADISYPIRQSKFSFPGTVKQPVT